MDGRQDRVLRGAALLQGCRAVLQERATVGDREGRGGALPGALRRGVGAVTRDDLQPRRRPAPRRHGGGGALGQERHGVGALEIAPDGARGRAVPQGQIVHPTHGRGGGRRDGEPAQPTPQGLPAHREGPALTAAHTGLPPSGHAEGHDTLGEPQGAPRPGRRHDGQPCRAAAATAVARAAKPLADAALEAHVVLRPRQIGQGPCVTAVDTPRRESAEGTWDTGLRRVHAQGALRRSGLDVTRVEAPRGRIGEQAGKDVGCWWGDASGFLLKATMSMGKRLWRS